MSPSPKSMMSRKGDPTDNRPALVSGKLAAIIIASIIGAMLLLVLALFLYKRHKRKSAPSQPVEPRDEEEEGAVGEKEVEAAPVVSGEMAYASQPAIPHSNGDLVAQQPKVVELGADGVVVLGRSS